MTNISGEILIEIQIFMSCTWSLNRRSDNKVIHVLELSSPPMKKSRDFPSNFGFIEFMCAGSVLNELAMSDTADDVKAQSYLLTGQTSENLRDVFLWMRPEAYYETCIRIRPRTAESESVGSNGNFISRKIRLKLGKG